MKPLSLAVVGADHPNKRGPGRRFELAMCAPGEPVELRPEPNNPADEHAIAVYSCRGIQIGYVRSERAPWIGKLMRETDVAAIFQHTTEYGAVIRAAFGGEQPTLEGLPTSERKAAPEPEFWADPEWPDEYAQ